MYRGRISLKCRPSNSLGLTSGSLELGNPLRAVLSETKMIRPHPLQLKASCGQHSQSLGPRVLGEGAEWRVNPKDKETVDCINKATPRDSHSLTVLTYLGHLNQNLEVTVEESHRC